MNSEIISVLVENHLHQLFFSKRSYQAEVFSCGRKTIFLRLNRKKHLTFLSGNYEPDFQTLVFPEGIPEFLISSKAFQIGHSVFKVKSIVHQMSAKIIENPEVKPGNTSDTESLAFFCKGSAFRNELKTVMASEQYSELLTEASEMIFKMNFPMTLFLKFCGLGPGLTPAGDDFLCGILLSMQINNFVIPERLKLLSILKKHTNSLSFGYLCGALSGRISKWQQRMITGEVNNEWLESLLFYHGSSSPADFAAGVLFFRFSTAGNIRKSLEILKPETDSGILNI